MTRTKTHTHDRKQFRSYPLNAPKMSRTNAPLSTNGLIMPQDFPVAEYESVHKRIEPRARTSNDVYEQFAGAWNAQAYRFLAVTEYETAFCASLAAGGGNSGHAERYRQERDLFGFFSNGFSVFEATFYGLFSLGAFLSAAGFPISTAKDQQRISPASTAAAIAKAFPGDPINQAIYGVLTDPAYLEWREVRNILTHRAAPGRTFFVGIGVDDALPDQWKIKSIPLDANMAPSRRAALSRLLTELLQGIDQFAKTRF
jgi:hypothetical protein